MSQERIDHAAEQAVTGDADPTEGQGLAAPAAHPGSGQVGGGTTATDDLQSPVGPDDRGSAFAGKRAGESARDSAVTEGERYVRQTAATAQEAQEEPADLGTGDEQGDRKADGSPAGDPTPARSDSMTNRSAATRGRRSRIESRVASATSSEHGGFRHE